MVAVDTGVPPQSPEELACRCRGWWDRRWSFRLWLGTGAAGTLSAATGAFCLWLGGPYELFLYAVAPVLLLSFLVMAPGTIAIWRGVKGVTQIRILALLGMFFFPVLIVAFVLALSDRPKLAPCLDCGEFIPVASKVCPGCNASLGAARPVASVDVGKDWAVVVTGLVVGFFLVLVLNSTGP